VLDADGFVTSVIARLAATLIICLLAKGPNQWR